MLHTNRHLHSGWIHSHDTHSASETFSQFEAEFAVLVLLFAKVLVVLMLLIGLLMITSSRVSGNAWKVEHPGTTVPTFVDRSITWSELAREAT